MAAYGTVRGKQVFCDVCGVYLPSATLLPTHNKGKKHQRLLNLKKERDSSSRRSVYVRGFQNSGSIEEELTKYFNVYGKVSNIFLDKDKGVFAIVEFADEESVTAVLTLDSLPLFNGKRLTVKERTINKAALQLKVQKSRKRKRHDSQQDPEGQLDNKEMASFLSEDLITKLKSSLTVKEQINLLMQHLCLTDEDIKLRRLVCQLLQEVFAEVYPGSSVVPFGSTVSGVGWKGSDLDVCLLTGVAPSQHGDDVVDYSLVIDMLRSFAPGCTNIIPVLTAKCPLVKFTHQPSGLSCDLSVNNRLGVANSDLLRCYMSLDPRIPQLVFIVRAWAKAKALTAGRHLTSYALTLMVLYFLQTQDPPVIPSLQQGFESWIKQRSHSTNKESHGYHESLVEELESTVIDNWNCSFFTDVTRLSSSNNNKSLSCLLEEFFYFFSTEFDFANCVVSIRHGHSTSITSVLEELKDADYLKTVEDRSRVTIKDDPTCKKQLTKVNHCESTSEIILSIEKDTEQQKVLPSSSMASSQSSPGSCKRTEFKISPVCVQDPFELVHNLTQNITVSTLTHITELMKTAHRICTDLNGSGDNPSNNRNKLLDLLTVCQSSKKRKSSHCHSFFVEYQDISLQALTGSQNAKLTTPREIFLRIIDSLEREFGFKCEKKLCDSEKDSDSSQATQPLKMSEGSHAPQSTLTESCTDKEKDSHANEERGQARKSDQNDKTEDNLSAICTAFENTWTHCRRERRKSLQSQRLQRNEKGETAGEDLSLDEKSEQMYPEKSGQCTLQISSSCQQPEKFANVSMVASPILIFQLTVSSSPGKDLKAGCTVSMDHAESSDFQLFGNFFSAYKNYFMGFMTVTK